MNKNNNKTIPEENDSSLSQIVNKTIQGAKKHSKKLLSLALVPFAMYIIDKASGEYSGTAHAGDNTEQGEYNPNGWPVPDISKSKHYPTYARNLDKDHNPNDNETRLEVYRAPNGKIFNTLSTDGKLWGYMVDADDKKGPDYLIVKSTKQGKFDKKYSPEVKFDSPRWVR